VLPCGAAIIAQPHAQHPTAATLNPKSQTPSPGPKPHTRSPTPKALQPKPYTPARMLLGPLWWVTRLEGAWVGVRMRCRRRIQEMYLLPRIQRLGKRVEGRGWMVEGRG